MEPALEPKRSFIVSVADFLALAWTNQTHHFASGGIEFVLVKQGF